MSDLRPHLERVIQRLRVHATSPASGFVEDPRCEDDPMGPGMSERWCGADQIAIAEAEIALRAIDEAEETTGE